MTDPLLAALGVSVPVLGAPMAGGASTPELVTSVGSAGGLGFLAAGYKTPDTLSEQVRAVRAARVPFGVNLFVPNPVPVDPAEFRRYARLLQSDAERYGLDLASAPLVEDDDHWPAKLELLRSEPVPLVSLTFGLPDPGVVTALRRAGTVVAQTVTNPDEARAAAELGVDALVVQGAGAGAHSGTLNPARLPEDVPLTTLLERVRSTVSLPVIAAGGLGTADDVASVLGSGAVAAMVGTVLLRTEESGASTPHKAALGDPDRTRTLLTRAFSGRPARALGNRFTDRYDRLAPPGYPAVHHLTSPLRKAAAAENNPELVNLWAGTAYRHAAVEPAGTTITRLSTHVG